MLEFLVTLQPLLLEELLTQLLWNDKDHPLNVGQGYHVIEEAAQVSTPVDDVAGFIDAHHVCMDLLQPMTLEQQIDDERVWLRAGTAVRV